ncbi:hypothetical protein HCN44_003281 [Aphidius gifuensis]|uniref:glutathione-specific gamma-glutamylcyclotransferase n=1 Tax=Aphidius gifuensis TaxID=684658 RepID=A0A834XLF6_APHGI|nr:putative glutathione-specific gamma-glutamylcyclotransferase 2 [Aphidius gifuensis]KAF7987519.1 hypothetical protein HCN44_003281 [Aphidius gifuensis]
MWVFGYGSLIWKVDFPYERKYIGYIKGYTRKFYQKSTDHRGVPSKPGRVVTLIASNNQDDEVWGIAYKISKNDAANVMNHLDFRERGGYQRKTVLFHPCKPKEKHDPSLLHNCQNSSNKNQPIVPLTPTPSEEMPFPLTIYIGEESNPNYAGTESIQTIAGHIVDAHGPSGSNKEYLYNLATAMRMIAPGVIDKHLFTLENAVKELETNTVPSNQDE